MRARINKPQCWTDVMNVIYSDVRTFVGGSMTTEPSAVAGTRGTAYAYNDFTLTADTGTINNTKMVAMFIDEADRLQQNYVDQMTIADYQAKIINEKVESLTLATHGSWKDFGATDLSNTGDDDTTQITISASNIDDLIRAIKRKLYTNNGVDFAVEKGIFIVWRASDFEFLEAFVQAGIKFIGLIKSSLINGEHLIAKAKATLRKAHSHLQRLSERTLLMSEATVRTA